MGATNYADVGDPEVKLYLRRRDGALRRRPEVGWLASVLMQKPRVSQPVLALPNEREVPIQGRRALTAWLHALMDADPKPKRWHWVRVTLAAEERGRNESRAVALDEIEEIDRDLAAKSNIEPQALHRW